MKKLIYIILFATFSSLVVTACTEEEVTPTSADKSNGGGNGSADPLKP